jgi:[NiFe] hydrogenase diaphorase moiety large subunit
LGQTSPNPILTTIKNFRPLYEATFGEVETGMEPAFDIKAALADAEGIAERKSVVFD